MSSYKIRQIFESAFETYSAQTIFLSDVQKKAARLYCNQKLLYDLLHRCCAETLLEFSADKKWLGATPGIIQVLHTWNQELDYHVHMHCIVSGGGLTKEGKIQTAMTS